jgi:hypothetical protein
MKSELIKQLSAAVLFLVPLPSSAEDKIGFDSGATIGFSTQSSSIKPMPKGMYLGLTRANIASGYDTDAGTDYSVEGASSGLFVGYARPMGRFVLGGEFAYTDGHQIAEIGFPGWHYRGVFDAKIRFGMSVGNFLPYVSGGYTVAGFSRAGSLFDMRGSNLSIGLDYLTKNNYILGVEFIQREVGNSVQNYSGKFTTATIRLGHSF